MDELSKVKGGAPQNQYPLTVVSRDQWMAAPPRDTEPLSHPIKTVVFAYNTGTGACTDQEQCCETMRQLQKAHMEKGLSDIFYNYCVAGDGRVYEGRGWHTKHPKNANYPKYYGNSFVIGVIGDGKDDKHSKPPYEVVAQGLRLVRFGKKKNFVIKNDDITEDYQEINPCQAMEC